MVNGNGAASRYRVDAVAKAMTLLAAFVAPPHRFSLTELSQRAALSKNQTFRLLQTLLDTGFVRQEAETKVYSLGVGVYQLAGALRGGDELILAASETLDWARDATAETINLIARDGADGAVCVDKRESALRLQITARIGARFALHAGASPKLLLAFADEEQIEDYLSRHRSLPALTPRTITESAALRRELQQIRERGYAVSDEDLDLGACAVAAPIRDRSGAVIAGVSVASPATRFGPAERERNRAIALAAGERVSAALGYRAAPSLAGAGGVAAAGV